MAMSVDCDNIYAVNMQVDIDNDPLCVLVLKICVIMVYPQQIQQIYF